GASRGGGARGVVRARSGERGGACWSPAGESRRRGGARFGPPCPPPIPPPATPAKYAKRKDCGCDFDCRCDGPGCRCAAKSEAETAVQNFRVRQDRIAARDGYSRDGEPLTLAEAEHALKCGGVSAARGELRFTRLGAQAAADLG